MFRKAKKQKDSKSKQPAKVPSVDMRGIMHDLMRFALGNQAYVLYPCPKEMDRKTYDIALAKMIEDGTAHGGLYPNLTQVGIEMALKNE